MTGAVPFGHDQANRCLDRYRGLLVAAVEAGRMTDGDAVRSAVAAWHRLDERLTGVPRSARTETRPTVLAESAARRAAGDRAYRSLCRYQGLLVAAINAGTMTPSEGLAYSEIARNRLADSIERAGARAFQRADKARR